MLVLRTCLRSRVFLPTFVLCSPWHLVCTAPRLSPGLRPPPLCRCAVHTKRQGCEQGLETTAAQGRDATVEQSRPRRRHAGQGGKSWSMVHSAQRHKGGVVGPRPTRRTAAKLSEPSAGSRARQRQGKQSTNGKSLVIRDSSTVGQWAPCVSNNAQAAKAIGAGSSAGTLTSTGRAAKP
jgi:hypothetical protein